MKKYIKPQVYEDNIAIDDILLVSVSDKTYDVTDVGGFNEIWD